MPEKGAVNRLPLKSLLFVPGDRPERMAKALGCGADALLDVRFIGLMLPKAEGPSIRGFERRVSGRSGSDTLIQAQGLLARLGNDE